MPTNATAFLVGYVRSLALEQRQRELQKKLVLLLHFPRVSFRCGRGQSDGRRKNARAGKRQNMPAQFIRRVVAFSFRPATPSIAGTIGIPLTSQIAALDC